MFEVGRIYNRLNDLHIRYGGQRQGGISTPNGQSFILLFTGESGEQYGYADGWDPDGVFVYTGEGQRGDMEFIRGNLAIRDHVGQGKTLHLFQSLGKGKGYRYVDEFTCTTYDYRRGRDIDNHYRRVIVFHLVRAVEIHEFGSDDFQSLTLGELRRRAYEASEPASEGNEHEAKRTLYRRSSAIRSYVLRRANGHCELCKKPAPFDRHDGSAYLEPHHIRRVSDGGPDHPRWIGAICPNCHAEIHYGRSGTHRNRKLELFLGRIEDAESVREAK